MADPTQTTEQQPELPTLDQLPANEYRAVREGKTVADVVAARPAPEEAPPAADPSTETPVRDAAGRFVQKVADKVADAVIADRTAAPASKAGNPRHDPKARVEELKGEIAQLAKEKGDTKAERDAIAAELATLRAERDALKPATAKTEPAAASKLEYPDELKSYEAYAEKNTDASYEEYMDARGDFRYESRSKVQQAEQAAATEHEQRFKPYWDREAAFKAKTPDFDAVIQRSPVARMELPPWVIEELRTSEHGPALRYYLAQHPDETAWMAGQPKAAAVSFLKGLFTAAPGAPTVTPAAEPQTKADPPFETVGASAAAFTHSLETVAAKGSAADFRRLRESGVRQ